MAAKLTEITTKYHTFIENQVLTSEQLNEFIKYFDDQDRLSRVFLTGVGIICGFTFDVTSNKITISTGVGITTDGDLVQLKTETQKGKKIQLAFSPVEFKHFKKFSDELAEYPLFRKAASILESRNKTVMDLWELFPGPVENSKPLSGFVNLDEMAVLLYLESYAREGDLCTAIDCDNQGIEQVAKLRVLLASKDDAEEIAKKDSLFQKYNVWEKINDLPELAVKRVVLNTANASSYVNVKQAFGKAVNDSVLFEGLIKGVTSLVQDFGPLLQLTTDRPVSESLEYLKEQMNADYPIGFQYKYDWLKDIVDTYNEIKTVLYQLTSECMPDTGAFPKHLMLGLIKEANIDIQEKKLRHGFYKSKALTCGANNFLKCRLLLVRLFNIIHNFQWFSGDIKITPSNKLTELSYKAIPFYLKENQELLKNWNHSKTQKKEETTNLWYHKNLLSRVLQVQEPLKYNIDSFDFYRIEGHQGKDYRLVLEKLNDLKKENGLAFQVKALSVNIDNRDIDFDDYECEFQDLSVMHDAWIKEQDCVLAEISNFFSSFSTKEPGVNVKEEEMGITRLPDSHMMMETTVPGMRTSTSAGSQEEKKPVKGVSESTDSKKSVYKIYNPVSDNLNTDEDTLGKVLVNVYDKTKGGSVNDMIAKSNQDLAEKFSTQAWNEQPELKELVSNDVVKLLAYSNYITQVRPSNLQGVTGSNVNGYKLSLEELCKQVKIFKARYESVALNPTLKSIIGIFINQLSSVCCAGKKLEILLDEIEKRVETILLRLKLSEFVKKHPGLEHKAGVPPGGTFVVVYYNAVQQKNELSDKEPTLRISGKNDDKLMTTFDHIRSTKKSESEKAGVAEYRISGPSIGKTGVESIKESEWRVYTEDFIRIPEISDNTVIADFALPYLCCSDCATIEYVILKPPASLRLEKDRYCLGKDTQPILMDISPEEGVVKTNPPVEGITVEGKKLIINEDTFPSEMFGEPVRFTVNDQVTDAVLIVYKAIEFDFEVPDSPVSQTEFIFIPTGELDGATFLWDFGDGNLSTERNPSHKYELPVNDENKVIVKLTVTAPNGVCQTSVEHSIEFITETKITLEKTIFCSNDENTYPFVVTPADSEVEIVGSGVVKTDDRFVFIPAQSEPGDIVFKVNGEQADLTVQVYPAPVSKFSGIQKENTLVLNNQSENATKFIWKINSEIVERDNTEPVVIPLTPNSPVTWEVSLQAIGADVCQPSVSEAVISTSVEKPTINLAKKEYCEKDDKTYPFIISPENAEVEITGRGVVKTDTGFVFSPAEAEAGEIVFKLNGEQTELLVVVQKAPVARFTANQEGNNLILTNLSENATNFIWTINEEKKQTTGTDPVIIELTPNSPSSWKIRLEARGAAVCGRDMTKWVTVNTDFIFTEVTNTCVEEIKAAVVQDRETLSRLNLANNDFVAPVWNATSELYGGTQRHRDGVIDNIDVYLKGENNSILYPQFVELLQETANRTVEIDRNRQRAAYARLVGIFELQLKLFYNILTCQEKDRLEEFRNVIQELLDQIIKILNALKRARVSFSNSLETFMQAFTQKVKDVEYLAEHVDLIKSRNLI